MIRKLALNPVMAFVLVGEVALAHELRSDRRSRRDDSSYAARARQTFELYGGSDGFGIGLFLRPDHLLEAGYGGFVPADSERAVAPGVWSDSFHLQLKSFHGNSFYTKLGLNHRRAGYVTNEWERPRWTETGVLLGLGNQWQWDWFTFGIDWVRAEIPFLRTKRLDPGESEEGGRKVTITPDGSDVRIRLSALRLSAGITF